MKFSAKQIADIIEGNIIGEENIFVSGLSKIEDGKPSTLTFLANMKYEEYIYSTGASIAIVSEEFSPKKELPKNLTLIKVENPYACFAQLLEFYNQMMQKQPKIEQPSFISSSAKIGKDVYIGAFAYISDNAEIGDNVKIYPNAFIGDGVKIKNNTVIHSNASIYHLCEIGSNCIIHSGAVIGADGFGFAPDENGKFSKVPQIGNVILEDHVEVGANTTIDRATLGSTVLKAGVKIDNLVQIAHNVEVGEDSAMAAQAGVAGSTKIGKNVLVGGQVGISGHITIANKTKIVPQTGVPSSIKEEDQTLMGSPGIPANDFKRSFVVFTKLPDLLKRLRTLEKKIKD